jgi:hypothetical protein
VTFAGATSFFEAVIGRTIPPLCAGGNARSALSDRPAAAFRRRPLLEGDVLVARIVWLSEMVASPVLCGVVRCHLLLK